MLILVVSTKQKTAQHEARMRREQKTAGVPVKHGVSSDVRSAQTRQNGVLMRFLEAEHMVETETARLVDHAMVPK